MKTHDRNAGQSGSAVLDGEELLSALVSGQVGAPSGDRITGLVVGQLVAITGSTRTPLVLFPGQSGSAAVAGRSVVDLHGAHIGRAVVLMFEGSDPAKPIVLGVLREGVGWPLEERPGAVAVDADGERLVITARHQLVLRCGRASITLSEDGQVTIKGANLSSHSSGANRIKGGSVELN